MKLTRTNAVFSRATSAVFFCAGFWIFRYAGKIPKKYIKNEHSGSFRKSKGGPQGSQGATRRVPGAAQPLAAPPALLAWSHVPRCPTLALFILLTQKPQNRSRFSNLHRGAATTLCSSPGELIWRLLWPPMRGNHRHRHHHRLSIPPP